MMIIKKKIFKKEKYYPYLSEIKNLKTKIKIQLTKLKNKGVIL